MWYEQEYGTKVGEFGCIPHPTKSYLAASPDGINTCPASDRYGRMVEVKNIFNREITGIPKSEYWIQMQVQMEVCNLRECDFLETRFIEYDNFKSFTSDGTFKETVDGQMKGLMMLFINKDSSPCYEYCPLGYTSKEYNAWNASMMIKHSSLIWMKNIYWKLDQVSVVLVVRNKLWFSATIPILDLFWDIIQEETKTGYEHRAPNKRIKSIAAEESKCLIDVSTL